jgi:Predicted acyltransferases
MGVGVLTTEAGAANGETSLAVSVSATGRRERIASLDGLRGIAALTVVLHHVVLASVPSLADAFKNQSVHGGLGWAMLYTPLHIVWAGPEAVCVFFVLSGYVLALPYLRTRFEPRSYYPRRFVRVFLPVWGVCCSPPASTRSYRTTRFPALRGG